MKKYTNVLKQGAAFVLVSGAGWLIDFGVYTYLTLFGKISVLYANIFSAIPAVTFVFFVSTKNIFAAKCKEGLWGKYFFYLLYQLFLVLLVSWLAQVLYDCLLASWLGTRIVFDGQLQIMVKLAITPVTICANFCVMQILTERL